MIADSVAFLTAQGKRVVYDAEHFFDSFREDPAYALRCLKTAVVGIHTHDDSGCGVANAVVAVEAGARQVQGTVNGYGERCGNANLVSIIPALQLKLHADTLPPGNLRQLTETARLIDEIANVNPNPNQPYVGKNAFAHKGGMHVAGIR